MRARTTLPPIFVLAFVALAILVPAGAQAAFGIRSGSFSANATDADGNADLQAGSHPYEYAVSFAINRKSKNHPEGRLRSVSVGLPPGLIGDPLAVPKCTATQMEGEISLCPGDTQVGVAEVEVGETNAPLNAAVYNLVPALGSPARLGFITLGFITFLEPSVRSDGDYGLDVVDSTVPGGLKVEAVRARIWGTPAEQSHDLERTCLDEAGNQNVFGCASESTPTPFLSLPTACGTPLTTTLSVGALEPGVYDDASFQSEPLRGCGSLSFEPTIAALPTGDVADSPTGLDFGLVQPQASTESEGAGGEGSVACYHGSWAEEPSEYSFQWLRNGNPIPGATEFEYQPMAADEGAVLQCEVLASSPAAAGPGRSVSEVKVIPPEPAAAVPSPERPVLYFVANTAYCEAYWASEFTYRWFKDGRLVPGQDESSYEFDSAEVPLTLQCEAIGSDGGGGAAAFSKPATSEPALEPALSYLVETAFGTVLYPPHLGLPSLRFSASTAPLKDAVVTLPEGLSLNPSAGNGLEACSNAEIGYQPSGGGIHFSKTAQSCPNASKVGTVEVESPLVDHKLDGAIYVAKPFENPFGTLLGIYLAIEDPQTGIVAKLGGKVEPDPGTGQLKATFAENPQLPLSDVDLHFFPGERAPLKTSLTCGHYTTTSTLTPWSAPEGADAHPTSSFDTSVAAGGSGPCPTSEAGAPKTMGFTAGTVSPLAGAYSPFVLRISRPDGSQHITGVEMTLPGGLLGKLAGISYCPESGIAQAKSREVPEQGKVEQASPSCPQASEVGTVQVTAGAGSMPIPVSGHAYLAGPYKGAPLSLVVIVPAIAGPFDLGTVVDRVALNVDESSARIHAVADPLPTIRDGIPLDVRSIELQLGRSSFTLNPTSCESKAIEGQVSTQAGQSAPLNNRFQATECGRLAFKPKLKLAFTGQTKRTGFPGVKAVLTQPTGDNANVAGATVILPKGMLIANAHINNPCTRVQFNSGKLPGEACPANSILGTAKVWTPLLEKPEEGNVYFRSNGGERELPDLAVALRGQVPLQLLGFVDSVGKKGSEVRRVRSRFLGLPDAPVSRFELKLAGGKKGLLQNSKNLCKVSDKAKFQLTGQNGKINDTEPKVQVSCGKDHKGKGKHHGSGKAKGKKHA